MVSQITAKLAVATLKDAVSDYNFWGESESDSPLVIKRTKTVLDDKKVLALDASARKKAVGVTGYKPPERTVRVVDLATTFTPLVQQALTEFQTGATAVIAGAGIETLEVTAEASEYYIQLYSLFKLLENPRVLYVEDTGNSPDPYTGLFITGSISDGETIYAQALLIQT
ncbi:MAG TPA: hypothetical protein DCQ51_09380 [Planktothrix sp. UBA8407]|jgi:hypothetical protein|nr:hypothetical protein [Planktothrix sp. UBA8407]